MRATMRLPLPALTLTALLALTGCAGGDATPDDPAGGGVPPQGGDATPEHGAVGQSEGYPDSGSAGEAQQ